MLSLSLLKRFLKLIHAFSFRFLKSKPGVGNLQPTAHQYEKWNNDNFNSFDTTIDNETGNIHLNKQLQNNRTGCGRGKETICNVIVLMSHLELYLVLIISCFAHHKKTN